MVEARNQLDSLIYTTEKTLSENKDKLSESDRRPVEDALSDAKKVLDSGDVNKIRDAVEKLSNTSHKIAELIYKQAGAQGGGSDKTAEKPKGEENVVDTEFEEVVKNK